MSEHEERTKISLQVKVTSGNEDACVDGVRDGDIWHLSCDVCQWKEDVEVGKEDDVAIAHMDTHYPGTEQELKGGD